MSPNCNEEYEDVPYNSNFMDESKERDHEERGRMLHITAQQFSAEI